MAPHRQPAARAPGAAGTGAARALDSRRSSFARARSRMNFAQMLQALQRKVTPWRIVAG